MSALLELEGVSLSHGEHAVLDGVSLAIQPGEVVALAGPSGSGKTSLLRVVSGLVAPTRGVVRLRGQEVSREGRNLVPAEARRLAMVFQDLALWPHLSVHGNLAFALDARGVARSERDRRIREVLARVELVGVDTRPPAALSGGERQRVALARALVTEPDLVLFDEALANLDVALQIEMLALIEKLLGERGTTALYVTHEPRETKGLARRVLVLEAGRLVQQGTLAELAREPRTAFVRAFAAGDASTRPDDPK